MRAIKGSRRMRRSDHGVRLFSLWRHSRKRNQAVLLYNSPFERLGATLTETEATDSEVGVIGADIDRGNLLSSSPFFNLRNAQAGNPLRPAPFCSPLFPTKTRNE